MTPIKEYLYRVEDVIALGIQLPFVAFPQLKKVKPTVDDDRALNVISSWVADFIARNEEDFNEHDERAMIRAFRNFQKGHPDLLQEYRKTVRILNYCDSH